MKKVKKYLKYSENIFPPEINSFRWNNVSIVQTNLKNFKYGKEHINMKTKHFIHNVFWVFFFIKH